MNKKIYLTLLILFINIPSFSQINTYGKIMPFDDSKNDASFYSFVTELKRELGNRNKEFIYSILDPSIEVSFGMESGISGFKSIWKLDNPDSDFWNIFTKLINLGFVRYNEGGYNFPYYWGSKQLENFECDAIIAINPNLNVYSSMSTESKIIGILSYDITKGYSSVNGNEEWYEIDVSNSRKGYIKGEDARAICDYRGGFIYKNGKWVLIWFLAGD